MTNAEMSGNRRPPMNNLEPCPVLGICGYSGAGKTTLIEQLLPMLRQRGLRIGVVKHDAHGLTLDHPGKDSDRLFRAGADLFIHDAEQALGRIHRPASFTLHGLLRRLATDYDLIIVEGHKETPLPIKFWLCRADEAAPPPEIPRITRVLQWTEARADIALAEITAWLEHFWATMPVHAGILIGGKSSRMEQPKHLLDLRGVTWLEHIVRTVQAQVASVVIIGNGEIPEALRDLPILPDAPDAVGGPVGGMRAAMRWAPQSGWLFIACDQPLISPAAIAWLLGQRRPGVRAIMPVLPGRTIPEPLLAWYDFRMAAALETVRRPLDLVSLAGVITPPIPKELAAAWRNFNTPQDVSEISAESTKPMTGV